MRAHPLRSIPGCLWFQLTHPPQQQNCEQHDQQTQRNANHTHNATLLASPAPTGWADCSLAEKPKVEKLQMDWLRSEDLKEEKNVTTPVLIIAVAVTGPAVFLRPPRRLYRRSAGAGRAVSLRVALIPSLVSLTVILFVFLFFVFFLARFFLKENIGGRRAIGMVGMKVLEIDPVHA